MYAGAASPPTIAMVAAGGNRSSRRRAASALGHQGRFGMQRRLDHLVVGPAGLHQEPAAARPTAHDAVGEHHQRERLLGRPVAGREQFLVDVEEGDQTGVVDPVQDRLGPEEHPARPSHVVLAPATPVPVGGGDRDDRLAHQRLELLRGA